MKKLLIIIATVLLFSSCIVTREAKRPVRKEGQSIEQYHKNLQKYYEKKQKQQAR